jgi:hypothetical protein
VTGVPESGHWLHTIALKHTSHNLTWSETLIVYSSSSPACLLCPGPGSETLQCFVFCFLVVLGFELRASPVPGRYSIT